MPSLRDRGERWQVAPGRNRKLRGHYPRQEPPPGPEFVSRLQCRRLQCPQQRWPVSTVNRQTPIGQTTVEATCPKAKAADPESFSLPKIFFHPSSSKNPGGYARITKNCYQAHAPVAVDVRNDLGGLHERQLTKFVDDRFGVVESHRLAAPYTARQKTTVPAA